MGRWHVVTGSGQKLPGNNWQWKRVLSFEGKEQQKSCYASTDNVGLPAVIVIGGAGYLLVHMH
jgi:hypothetical protein